MKKSKFPKWMSIAAMVLLAVITVAEIMSGDLFGMGFGTMIALTPFIVPAEVGLSEKEQKGLEALAKHFEKWIGENEKGLINDAYLSEKMKSALEDHIKEFGITKDSYKALNDELEKQGLAIKSIKENPKGEKADFRKMLKDFLSSDDFKANVKGRKVSELEIKTATTITSANVDGDHILSYEVLPGINSAPKEQNLILLNLNKGTTQSKTIIWINRKDKEGGAAFIGEGGLKPLKDWTYEEETSVAKKVAVSAKVSTEMLTDFAFMESEIRRLLTEDLYDAVDDKLLTGATADEPTGILTVAGGYVATSLDESVFSPNNADAIRAAMLQMRILNYKPDVVFLNPGDRAVIDLTKSTTGNYIAIELNGIIRDVRIVETTAIPAGKFLLIDTGKWIVRVLENLRLEFGWENDDFRKNLVTIVAEMRLHSYQNSIDAGSAIYEDFDVVKAAIGIVEETPTT